MNYKLGIYIKTFSRDFLRVQRLVESIRRFNVDNIPLYISCPTEEMNTLQKLLGTKSINFLFDDDIYVPKNLMGGWEQQMLIKMYACKTLPCDNILLIDSDAQFIREFKQSDFIAYGNVPYTIIHENKQVSEYEKVLKGQDYLDNGYSKAVRAYRSIFGGKSNKIYDFGPNPHLWSKKVFEDLDTKYLKPNELDLETFSMAVKQSYGIHFRETLTYGEYLLAAQPIPIIPCGPFFKTYHWKEMVDFEKGTGLEVVDNIKSSYLGLIMQSNFSE